MHEYETGLVWLRRDLRLFDHAALHHALRRCRRVWCVFVFDTAILEPLLQRGLRVDRRVEFILASLAEVDAGLREQGSALLVLHDRASVAIARLAAQLQVEAVFANRDYEPAARQRDARVARQLEASGIAWHDYKDQVIFEQDEVLTAAGRPFSVYTPYRNAWNRRLLPADVAPLPCDNLPGVLAPVPAALAAHTVLPGLAELGFSPSGLKLPTGMNGASQLLEDFLERIGDYDRQRDFPAIKGPSYLSTHLRFGTVSIRALARAALAHEAAGAGKGTRTWLNELVWRDFYFQILFHHPQVVQQAFKPAYEAIVWDTGEHADALFAAWCAGRTGYPLIDAAMAQINQTGYMHNRLRMVVASFLTKDLGIDWRRGEQYFADQLIDFDLAANNGGWQWAASTGCDAQPWFRIFNPVTQSEKFDPEGKFIRRYLPALSQLTARQIHAPWLLGPLEQQAAGLVIGTDYPAPVVQHDQARARTLQRYAVVKKVQDNDPGASKQADD
jgi:deoxyribodipyrimidine photo-lyase